ncbi:transcription initiation factor TFIID subunit 5-like isoform X2 [Gastrolobium bilobum]|uniref:transcription initiation factor TFIID subunit 5-like isoform X2 n=1 Tax=Gastrolobium bilobum TaxID=150636 RepID=UPI002AB2EBE9|nr:transcription initiation factor TFIID subunit 5-like isoform X2 [Gastrolobium bilobum]
MDEDQIEGCVSGYLKEKGFTRQKGEELQRTNNNTDSSLQPDTVNRTQLERGFARYHDGYGKLRSWAYRSLDLYKPELLRVLYPVFIHCFMDLVAKGYLHEARTFFNSFREDHETKHLRDLQKLEGVLSPTHLEEMEFAHSLRQSKFILKICGHSYELLMQHLHSTQSTTIIGIINEHINFQVTTGQPSSISDDPEAVTLSGSIQDAANLINQKEMLWGLLDDLEDRIEKAGALLSDTEKGLGEAKAGEHDESKKRLVDGGKQGGSIKKVKKDKAGNATGKSAKPEANSISAPPCVKPELPLPIGSTELDLSILEDLRNRVQLSSVSLPSVNFYTFTSTHSSLNCSSISHDGSLVAGGFSDSSLKVWDMAKLEQPTSSFSQGWNDTSQNEQILGRNGRKRQYTLFQGHSGPVYATTFSPFGDFILSSSADKTIRLWSTKLNTNLVCYQGHNYPVWDVQFSPAGHFFASSSHDRTARIWSMDRIQPLRIMAGHLSDVDCVQWHANCNYIATGSSDKTVRLWDVQSGECVRVFIGHRSMILSLAMSPDGRYMASGDEDGTIMMWDLSSGCCVTPLIGHTSCVWTLGFSCEGSLLASGSADCTVKFWDVTTGTKVPRNEEKSGNTNRLRSLKNLPTKSTPVYSLQFSRRNLLFAAGALA